jgi:soluble lytic murein transglycosylase
VRKAIVLLWFALAMMLTAEVNAKPNYPKMFNQAEQALNDDDQEKYFKLKHQLEDYVLYPYLQYLEILANFDNYSDETIENYLNQNNKTFWGYVLRRKWLDYLGEHGEWSTYQKNYVSSGNRRACWHIVAEYEVGSKDKALKDFTSIWTSGSSIPSACDQMIDVWQQSKFNTNDIKLKKISLLISSNKLSKAKEYAQGLPQSDRVFMIDWADTRNDPIQGLPEFIKQYHNHVYFDQALVDVVDHFAYSSPIVAGEYWKKLENKQLINTKTENLAQAEIATSLARIHNKQAIYWLEAVNDKYADSLLWQWRIRTAVYWEDWSRVVKWSSALPNNLAKKDVWQYWYAVGLWHVGQKDQANAIWKKVAQIRDYYGFLAADQIDAPYAIETVEQPVSEAIEKSVLHSTLVKTTGQLFIIGKDDVAVQYFRWSATSLSREEALAVANIADHWKKYNLVIYSLMLSGYSGDLEKRFPVAYYNKIVKATNRYNIDPVWVLALMRQESHFRVDAGSWVGAKGLMQLMPNTAEFIAKHDDIPYDSVSQLFSINTNINLGVANLAYEKHNFKGNMILATAAYNAGMGNVRNWMPARSMRAQRWVLSIPFLETRKYVNNILAYYIIYQHVKFHNESLRLSTVMKNIPSKNGG